ncbi:MAG: DUF6266 family protein [Dysgonamonadaceae bacterium]|jgi:TusA-related sulfurtransferase|nr:DUF6266 family protein [Dysgonamonadaceae bacterium]
MAIIDSVVIGTGRKKVGEVTLSTIKGRTIARKYQSHVSNPNTKAQQKQRNKLYNALLVYHAIKNILSYAFPKKGKYESNYNASVSANIGLMPIVRVADAREVVATVGTGVIMSNGSLGKTIATAANDNVVIDFTAAVQNLVAGDILMVIINDYGTGKTLTETIELSDAQITAGSVEIEFSQTTGYVGGAYIAKANGKDCSQSELFYF